MTTDCTMCGHNYGVWRTQCPACGSANEARERAIDKQRDEQRQTDRQRVKAKRAERREKKRQATECIVCRCTGAKLKCPHCSENIHKGCLSLHDAECREFQRSLIESYKKHGVAPSPSLLKGAE